MSVQACNRQKQHGMGSNFKRSTDKPWSKQDIPTLTGKLAIVTGATSGLGYETALALAEADATVILASRNEEKGKTIMERICSQVPKAKLIFEKVDLASLESVAQFCTRVNARNQAVDILVNNAGLNIWPNRETTVDGFELHFGTNHLAHFALTAQLMPVLQKSGCCRVVNVSSLVNREGKIYFNDLQLERNFNPKMAYAQSKLANNLFTLELQRRSEEGNWGIVAITAHPGFARTDAMNNGFTTSFQGKISKYVLQPFLSQDAATGALPPLYAATSPDVIPGAYYGPNGFYELKGSPKLAYAVPAALDVDDAKHLWDVSVHLTGVTWP